MGTSIPFIDVDKITQEKYYYCGQACMKMFDSHITESQDDLWNLTQKYSREPNIWYTDPVGLATSLEEISNSFVSINVFESSTSDHIARSLVSPLYSYKPVLIPSRGGAHWVIVNGVNLNEKGDITGVFVVDPWKGMPGISLYPFSSFFFDNYFSEINFGGEWAGKRIAIFGSYLCDELPLDICLQIALGGGSMSSPASLTKEEIFEACCFNFERLGLGIPLEIKAGGYLSQSVTVRDMSSDIKYRITPLELKGDIVWSVLNLNTLVVESVCFSDELVLYSYQEIEEIIKKKYPNSSVKVYEEAMFDCKSQNLLSFFDFVYKAQIDDLDCYIKASDFTVLYDLNAIVHPLNES